VGFMVRKPNQRGRGRGRGSLVVTLGKGSSGGPVTKGVPDQNVFFDETSDLGILVVDQTEESLPVDNVILPEVENLVVVEGNVEVKLK
jgi:hypothetical protein